MANDNNVKKLDLDKFPLEDLELMFRKELYIDIDSPFAESLRIEIERRRDILESNNG
jgi:hypothetical protein